MASLQVVALPVGGALAAFFTYKVKFPSTLFSYHPTLLGLGWLAITPYAMKYLRDSKVSALPPKKRCVWRRPVEVVVWLNHLRPCPHPLPPPVAVVNADPWVLAAHCEAASDARVLAWRCRPVWRAASIRRKKRRPCQDPCAPQQVRRFAAARQTPNPCNCLPSTAF
jgi:hypothetical protein